MQQTPEPLSRRGILTALALFAGGFVAIALLLHLMLRDPLHLHADVRSEKLEMLARLQGSVHSAAFGSSHVHNGFAPLDFDRELAGSPAPELHSQTINLAIEGGSQAEQRVMALEFVRHLETPPPGQSCMVLLELNAGANFLNNYLVHPRTIDIYDWRTTRFIASLTAPGMPLTQRVGRTGYAVAAGGLHYINLGMLSNKIFAPALNQSLIDQQLANNQRGQEVLAPAPPGNHELDDKIAALHPSSKTVSDITTPGLIALPDELEAASRVKNLAFVYFVYPKLSDLEGPPAYPDHLVADGRDIPIINLAQPALNPWLYEPKYWHDEAHLDGTGAALMSAIFAQRLKAWYAQHGTPPTCGAN